MFKIAVCEDSIPICSQIKEICAKCLTEMKIYDEIHIFYSGADFLKSGLETDILLLDVEMPVTDGISVAKKLRENRSDTRIIFLTSHSETQTLQRAIEIQAFRYLIKPVNPAEVRLALSAAVNAILEESVIEVGDNKRNLLIKENKIMYLESIGDSAVVHTAHMGNIISGKTLKYYAAGLSPVKFFKTHKSYIVSMGYIEGVEKTFVRMTNGDQVPLSKRNATRFRESLNSYIRNLPG